MRPLDVPGVRSPPPPTTVITTCLVCSALLCPRLHTHLCPPDNPSDVVLRQPLCTFVPSSFHSFVSGSTAVVFAGQSVYVCHCIRVRPEFLPHHFYVWLASVAFVPKICPNSPFTCTIVSVRPFDFFGHRVCDGNQGRFARAFRADVDLCTRRTAPVNRRRSQCIY